MAPSGSSGRSLGSGTPEQESAQIYGTPRAGNEKGAWGQLDIGQQPPTAGVKPLHPVLTILRSAMSDIGIAASFPEKKPQKLLPIQ